METETIKTGVAELLAGQGIRMKRERIPTRTDRTPTDWDKDAGHWRITFEREGARPFTLEYSQGSGHKVWTRNYGMFSGVHGGWKGLFPRRPVKGERAAINNRSGTAIWALEKYADFPAPHPADIVSCLITDAGACDQSFSDWCRDSGCDDDSISAKQTYELCRDQGYAARAMFGSAWDDLTELCQEY